MPARRLQDDALDGESGWAGTAIMAQLAASGIVERRGPSARLLREFEDHEGLDRFLGEFERRQRDDCDPPVTVIDS